MANRKTANRKTVKAGASVEAFIESIADERKREDCQAIASLMAAVTGEEPSMWGPSIIGFGTHHYQYANGKPAEICRVGFAPRARSFAFYLAKYPEQASLVEKLGRHRYSGGCLHIARLSDVDSDILACMIENAYGAGGACDD